MLLHMKKVLCIFASVVVGGVVLFFLAAAFVGSLVIGGSSDAVACVGSSLAASEGTQSA